MIILNHQQISQKIKRIAYQILESNPSDQEIHIVGINGNGYKLAEKIFEELKKIDDSINFHLDELSMDKKNPFSSMDFKGDMEVLRDKPLILVDDVLESGTTLMYGVSYFLQIPLKKFKTAVLVNRNHKKYPVKADFKGISLSTSLNSHVEVSLKTGKCEAILVES